MQSIASSFDYIDQRSEHHSQPFRCAVNHAAIGSGAVIVTCGVEAKEERARHSKGQHPDSRDHEGHTPTGALSCAMLVVNWHDHCSVPVKGRGERIDMMRKVLKTS